MKRVVQVFIFLGIALLVITGYFHVYETSSTGLLPYIDYPLRQYALPFLILGIILLVSGIVLKLHRETK